MNRFNPIHSIPRRLKSEKGPLQRGGLLYLSPRMLGKRRLPQKRRRRTQRGGLVFTSPPGYDIVRELQKRYKSVDRRKRRKTRRTRF